MSADTRNQSIISRAQSHIIERPRLTKLLDATNARIIALVAPAGYGKTTLAHEWMRDQPAGYYRATTASSDVAALAMGIAEAAAHLVPGAGERMRRRLASPQAPELDRTGLATMLARDFAEWPPEAWLVIDDYQLAASSQFVTDFMDTLTSLAPVQLLIASRERPMWITSRRLLYGEVLEVDQSLLALSDEEARSVLQVSDDPRGRDLLEQAKGWPAVIGLAALTDAVVLPEHPLPLYDFFADELYHEAPHDLRRSLRRLAVLPKITEDLARLAVGASAGKALDAGVSAGFLFPDGKGAFEIHPLLHQFLRNKLVEENDDLAFVESVVHSLLRLQNWDDAFVLIEEYRLDRLLPDLIDGGLAPALRLGRLATIERWVEHGRAIGTPAPVEYLAEAEIAKRRGSFRRGELFALQAAKDLGDEDPRASRSYAVAGECAHLTCRFEDALEHFSQAESLARSPDDARRAAWGQVVATVHLERDADEALQRFSLLAGDDVSHRLRVASGRLCIASFSGHVLSATDLWGRQLESVEQADEPMASSFYCYRLGVTLLWAGRYREALAALEIARREAEHNGFEFALPHIANAEIGARIGLRQFVRAAGLMDERIATSPHQMNTFEQYNRSLLRIRLALARRQRKALIEATEVTADDAPTVSLRGECLALQAFSAIALEDADGARSLADEAVATSRDVEVQTLASLAQAISALKCRPPQEASAMADHAARVLRRTEAFDCLVTAYRVFPGLLREIKPDHWPVSLTEIVEAANDHQLALAIGLPARTAMERLAPRLTRREAEVFNLMCKGLTNKEIAASLFITEVTVKVHVKRILAKFGVRSRTEAVLHAYAEA